MSKSKSANNPEAYRWNGPETYKLVHRIASDPDLHSLILPDESIVQIKPSIRLKMVKELCLDILAETSWMETMISLGWIERNHKGELRVTEAWNQSHTPVGHRLTWLRQKYQQTYPQLGAFKHPEELPEAQAGSWSRRVACRDVHWFFLYHALIRRDLVTLERLLDENLSETGAAGPSMVKKLADDNVRSPDRRDDGTGDDRGMRHGQDTNRQRHEGLEDTPQRRRDKGKQREDHSARPTVTPRNSVEKRSATSTANSFGSSKRVKVDGSPSSMEKSKADSNRKGAKIDKTAAKRIVDHATGIGKGATSLPTHTHNSKTPSGSRSSGRLSTSTPPTPSSKRHCASREGPDCGSKGQVNGDAPAGTGKIDFTPIQDTGDDASSQSDTGSEDSDSDSSSEYESDAGTESLGTSQDSPPASSGVVPNPLEILAPGVFERERRIDLERQNAVSQLPVPHPAAASPVGSITDSDTDSENEGPPPTCPGALKEGEFDTQAFFLPCATSALIPTTSSALVGDNVSRSTNILSFEGKDDVEIHNERPPTPEGRPPTPPPDEEDPPRRISRQHETQLKIERPDTPLLDDDMVDMLDDDEPPPKLEIVKQEPGVVPSSAPQKREYIVIEDSDDESGEMPMDLDVEDGLPTQETSPNQPHTAAQAPIDPAQPLRIHLNSLTPLMPAAGPARLPIGMSGPPLTLPPFPPTLPLASMHQAGSSRLPSELGCTSLGPNSFDSSVARDAFLTVQRGLNQATNDAPRGRIPLSEKLKTYPVSLNDQDAARGYPQVSVLGMCSYRLTRRPSDCLDGYEFLLADELRRYVTPNGVHLETLVEEIISCLGGATVDHDMVLGRRTRSNPLQSNLERYVVFADLDDGCNRRYGIYTAYTDANHIDLKSFAELVLGVMEKARRAPAIQGRGEYMTHHQHLRYR